MPDSCIITKISKASATEIRMTVEGSSFSNSEKVHLYVMTNEGLARTEVNSEGSLVPQSSPDTFQFIYETAVMQIGVTDFILVTRNEDGSIKSVGAAYLDLIG